MPVVLTDKTNKVWCVELPTDGLLHVGYTGEPGPRLQDVLDFVRKRQKQFDNFLEKRKEEEAKEVARDAIGREVAITSTNSRVPENRRSSRTRKRQSN